MVWIGIGSAFFHIATQEIKGAIEDYCERLGDHSNTLVGLTSSMGSIGFVLGPILSGAIASSVGGQLTFGIIGWGLAAASIILFIITPRKIRLPQQAINRAD
jgi:MFS family permease